MTYDTSDLSGYIFGRRLSGVIKTDKAAARGDVEAVNAIVRVTNAASNKEIRNGFA